MRPKRWFFALFLSLGLVHSTQAEAKKPPRFAVIVDGPSETFQAAIDSLKVEIESLLKPRFPSFVFPAKATHTGDFTTSTADRLVKEALASTDHDYVLGLGFATGTAVGRISELTKPVFLPFAAPQLQNLPNENGKSGRKNLAYLGGVIDLKRELQRFNEVIHRDQVVFVVDQTLLESGPKIPSFVTDHSKKQMKASFVGAGTSAKQILDALGPDTQAEYLGPLVRLPSSETAALLEGLIKRKLPSYASEGKAWVKAGAFVSLVHDEDEQRRLRRIALYIESAVSGDALESMSVVFVRRAALVINMATAKKIGIYPSFELMTEAQLVGLKNKDRAPLLKLNEAVDVAVANNFDLTAARQELPIANQQLREATGAFLPQVDATGQFNWLDPDVSNSFSNAERTLSWGLTAQQLLFSPLALGALRAQSAIVDSAEASVRTIRLDTVRNSAVFFLNVLRAKTAEQVNRQNLRSIRRNLELAELRVQIGSAGRQEVFRWTAEIANSKAAVIQSNATRNQAELALNQSMNRPLETPLELVVPKAGPQSLLIDKRLQAYVQDPWSFRVFRNFMAKEAVKNSPEVAQLNAAIAAQEQLLSARQMQLFLPDAFLSGGFTHTLSRTGAGSDDPDPMSGFPARDDFTWQFGLGLNFRVFDWARYAQIEQTRATLTQLQASRDSAAQRVEQGLRASLHQVSASRAAMKLRQQAAEASQQNLQLVADAYQKGIANVITLIDAQNQALQSQLASANAIFDFLVDFLEVERASGRFGFRSTPETRNDFVERLNTFAAEARTNPVP